MGYLAPASFLGFLALQALAYGSADSVKIDDRTLTEITAVVRTGDSQVTIRSSVGLTQEQIEKLPDSFLQSWGIPRKRSRAPEDSFNWKSRSAVPEPKFIELANVHSFSVLAGGVVEYYLRLLPEHHVLWFGATGIDGIGSNSTPGFKIALVVPENQFREMLFIFLKFDLMTHDHVSKRQLLGTLGNQELYFSSEGLLTASSDENAIGDEILMRTKKGGQLVSPAYIAPYELRVFEGFLKSYKVGESQSASASHIH